MNGLTYSYLRAAEKRDALRERRKDDAVALALCLAFAALLALTFTP
ncbi:MAG: hypothetical protein LBI35_04425 [Burkholderiales bacterium]|jgi:hypothetical protein|nr:hypothetical protein [Burkholderiales bacterium]